MPTILWFAAYRVMINTKDHKPAHVHCVGPDRMIKIAIESLETLANEGVSSKDERRLKEYLGKHTDVLMNEWRRIHGED